MPVKSFFPSFPTVPLPRNAPRLISVTSTRQRYTLRKVSRSLRELGVRHDRWTYEKLLSKRRLPRATYILTDFDRVHPWIREIAAVIYDRLTEEGLTVLNDPRLFLPRDVLLKRLYRAGINSFDCWRPIDEEWPERYPVFLRTIHGHRGVESDLLHSEGEAHQALETALSNGYCLADLIFIEYRSEQTGENGIFRKFASYSINGEIIRAHTVSQSTWMAKIGELGVATENDYLRDLEEQRSDPYEDVIRKVFEIAGASYGRIDFGVVADKSEIYELNTNPVIGWQKEHPSEIRLETDRIIKHSVLQELSNLGYSGPNSRISVSDIWHRWDKGWRGFGQT